MSRNTKAEFIKPFGNRRVSIKSLNRNKLSIFTAEGSKVVFREEMISDNLKSVIKAIIRGDIKEVEEDVELLSDVDRKLLFKALAAAQIETAWESNHDSNKEHLIHRFNILKGEIMLGNAGPDTLQEFKSVIDECFDKKMLNKKDYYSMKDLILNNISNEE